GALVDRGNRPETGGRLVVSSHLWQHPSSLAPQSGLPESCRTGTPRRSTRSGKKTAGCPGSGLDRWLKLECRSPHPPLHTPSWLDTLAYCVTFPRCKHSSSCKQSKGNRFL